MRGHSANELTERASLLDVDGVTVLAANVYCGIEDLAGRRLEQAQLSAAETTHKFTFRSADVALLPSAGYITSNGKLYIVDGPPLDPRVPRPGMWAEILCHVEGVAN